MQPEERDPDNPLIRQVSLNVVYTLTASLYFVQNSHYTSGGHLDPLSSVLMLAGVAGVIAVLTRRRSALWLLLSFLARLL